MKKSPLVIPLGDRVIVSPPSDHTGDQPTERKVGGVIIPESAQNVRGISPHYIAKVIAIGPDCKRVKVGQRVIIERGRPFPVKLDNIDFMVILEPAIVAVLR